MVKQKQQTAEYESGEDGQPRSPRTFKKYNAVVQSAELVDIRLTSSKFDVNDEYYSLKRSENDQEKRSVKLGMGGSLLGFKYLKKEGLMLGDFEWSALGTKGRKRLLSIRARYLVIYKTATGLEDSYVGAFLANVGRFAAFPYFRTLVATYSAAASVDLPILPVLRQPIDTAPDEDRAEA
jgi:hypothetical protein